MPRTGLLGGKVALVTGAATGQGRAAALLFAEQGAAIVIADLDDEGAADTAARAEGGRSVAVHADVSRPADCDAMVDAAIGTFGRLDVLCTTVATRPSGRLVETTEEQWDRTIATNLSAVFWVCRAAIPQMIAGGRGSIVTVASVPGLAGSEGGAAFGAAAAGVIALTRQIAAEYGPAVRANVIVPGSLDTAALRSAAQAAPDPEAFLAGLLEGVPLRRLGTAEDVARVALFLAGDESSHTSGAVVPADGGLAAFR